MEFVKCSIGGIPYGRGMTEVEKALARRGKGGESDVDGGSSDFLGQNNEASDSLHPIKGFNFRDERIVNGQWVNEPCSDFIQKFFLVLAICHTAIPDEDKESGEISYEAESPDEAAFVIAARELGFEFFERKQTSISLHELNYESGKKVDRLANSFYHVYSYTYLPHFLICSPQCWWPKLSNQMRLYNSYLIE